MSLEGAVAPVPPGAQHREAPVRVGIIGKFPPIEGGVSTRTYWTAHALAGRGHDVRVITNAKEAAPPFRMHMREEDWQRCAAEYGSGAVTMPICPDCA